MGINVFDISRTEGIFTFLNPSYIDFVYCLFEFHDFKHEIQKKIIFEIFHMVYHFMTVSSFSGLL
jgi:hypothetical protein